MEYRPLATAPELELYGEMARLAFTPDWSRQQRDFWLASAPFTRTNTRGLVDPAGTLLAALRIMDDGALYFRSDTPIPTALITSVVTPPEHRRKGYVKDLFLRMYAELRAQGTALTALYPFYFPFYRALGYELAHDAAYYTVKIEQFKPWQRGAGQGRFVPAQLDPDWEAMNAVYTAWARRNLGGVARDRGWWFRKFNHNQDFAPAYLYYDAADQPAGYIIYHLQDKGNWDRDLAIHEMGARDRAAWEAIYGFIYNHDSQAGAATFWLPVDAAFASQIPDPRAAEVRVHPGYMLRLLDVAGAFQQRTWAPEAEGAFAFALADPLVPEQAGAYRVQVRDGRAEVMRRAADAGAGVRLDIRALSQLYSGYLSPARAAALGQIQVDRAADLQGMQAVLSPPGQPAPFMNDSF